MLYYLIIFTTDPVPASMTNKISFYGVLAITTVDPAIVEEYLFFHSPVKSYDGFLFMARLGENISYSCKMNGREANYPKINKWDQRYGFFHS